VAGSRSRAGGGLLHQRRETRSPTGAARTVAQEGSTAAGSAEKGVAGASSSQSLFQVGTAATTRSRNRSASSRAHSGQPHLPAGMWHMHMCSVRMPSSRSTGPSAAPKAAGAAIVDSTPQTHARRSHRRSDSARRRIGTTTKTLALRFGSATRRTVPPTVRHARLPYARVTAPTAAPWTVFGSRRERIETSDPRVSRETSSSDVPRANPDRRRSRPAAIAWLTRAGVRLSATSSTI